jgi:Ca2+-binding RTX toxin-like protein
VTGVDAITPNSSNLGVVMGGGIATFIVNGVASKAIWAAGQTGSVVFTEWNDYEGSPGGWIMLDGRGGDDHLEAGPTTTLLGGTGNDYLVSGAGANAIDGGLGTDTVSYEKATTGVTVNFFNLAPAQQIGSYAAGDTLSNLENVIGSGFNDTFIAGSASNGFAGGAGIDTIDYHNLASGVTITLSATDNALHTVVSGVETIIGTAFNDSFTGTAGNETFVDAGGSDTFTGGGGVDTVDYSSSAIGVTASLVTGATNLGGALGDTYVAIANLTGSNLADSLVGNTSDNFLNGGGGNDTLEGGTGNDTFDGGAGTDTVTYVHATGAVTVDLTAGTATGAERSDMIVNVENITGSAFADSLTGNAGNNVIGGGAGDDVISGGGGKDTLSGGAGNDNFTMDVTSLKLVSTVDSGSGNDTLHFIGATSSITMADLVASVKNVETIDFGSASVPSLSFRASDIVSMTENNPDPTLDNALKVTATNVANLTIAAGEEFTSHSIANTTTYTFYSDASHSLEIAHLQLVAA